jgi:hypothetical protein
MRIATLILTALTVACVSTVCTSAQDEPGPPIPEITLADPEIVMEADPPPPFTYWASEGSTIRNHPRVDGVWVAEQEGEHARYYYGDECNASRYQRFVGHPMDVLPDKPEDAVWRQACTTCAVHSDLGRARMNIFYDEDTRIIERISCG